MKCLSRSRNLVATVLVLLLAASAPAALALPAGPGGGGGAGMTWDVQAWFDWMQDVFEGFFGGVGGKGEGPGQITERVRADSVPDGHELRGRSTAPSTQDLPSLEDGLLEK